MRKTFFTVLFVFAVVLAVALPVFVYSNFIYGDVSRENKAFYDAFAGIRVSANNNRVEVSRGIILVSDSKKGWYLSVYDDDLVGLIEVAYKIGNNYFSVIFDILGIGKYFIGDGSGKNGVNQCKVGRFISSDDGTGGGVEYHTIKEAPVEIMIDVDRVLLENTVFNPNFHYIAEENVISIVYSDPQDADSAIAPVEIVLNEGNFVEDDVLVMLPSKYSKRGFAGVVEKVVEIADGSKKYFLRQASLTDILIDGDLIF